MKKRSITPRKEPKQNRSKEMKAIILEATARILNKDGYQILTTNKVAEKAGISIGSLYQYFPNKDSLVLSLAFKMMEDDYKHFEKIQKPKNKKEQMKYVEELLLFFLELHKKEGRLRLEIYNLVFKLGASKEVLELRHKLINFFASCFMDPSDELNSPQNKAKAFVLFHSCFGVMQAMSIDTTSVDLNWVKHYLMKSFA